MPTIVNLENAGEPVTENTPKQAKCTLINAKPGKSHTVFKLKIGSAILISSTGADLRNSSELSFEVVDVTFEPEFTLQRQYNGLDMVCEATWMGSTVISSAATAVDVRCKEFMFVVSHPLYKIIIYVQY